MNGVAGQPAGDRVLDREQRPGVGAADAHEAALLDLVRPGKVGIEELASDTFLIAGTQLFDVSSSFAMEQLKFTTALPLRYAD